MTPLWFQPLATFVAAVLVLSGAGVTLAQRRRADRKDQWWKRTQWAVDHVLGDPRGSRGEVGLRILQEQSRSTFADVEDRSLLAVIIDMRLATMRSEGHTEDDGEVRR